MKTVLRKTVSISLLMSFIMLATTGVIAFVLPYIYVVEALHIFSGLVFTIAVMLHLVYNFSSLKRYILEKR